MSTLDGQYFAGLNTTPSSKQYSNSEQNPERALIGIPPAENDEHDRGLFFYFDSWTGNPSQTSASEGSEYAAPVEDLPKARSSDHSSSLPNVMTPPSDSDVPMTDVSHTKLNQSQASSPSGVNIPGTPSTSEPGTLGSHNSVRTYSRSLLLEGPTPPPLSPSAEFQSSFHVDPLEGIKDPRDTIVIDREDINFLQQFLRAKEGQSQRNNITDSVNPLHDPGSRTGLLSPKTRNKPKSPRTSKIESNQNNHSISRLQGAKKGHRTKKERHLTEEGRQRAHALRKVGACLRCLYNHEPCGLGETCPRCKEMKSPRIWMLPCVRLRLIDAELHRTGFLSFPEGLPPIPEWAKANNVTVSLYNIGNADPSSRPESRPRLQIKCRQHAPIPGVRTNKSWTKEGKKIDIDLPPYAMTEHHIKDASKKMDELIDEHYFTLVQELGTGQDEIVIRTLAEAIRQAENCDMLKDALKICVMSRLASKSFNLSGENLLGIASEQDPDCPYYKRIPIPPLFDAQLDSLWMQKMSDLRKGVLASLRAKIVKRGRENWLIIFLTIQVLIFNLEFIYQNQDDQSKHYHETTPRQRTMLAAWEHAAKILMAHFHTICHGTIPLSVDWNEEVRNAVHADEQSLAFLTDLKKLVQSRIHDLSAKAKGGAGQPLVWISALFLPHEK